MMAGLSFAALHIPWLIVQFGSQGICSWPLLSNAVCDDKLIQGNTNEVLP